MTLDTLIPIYAQEKEASDSLKKSVESKNADIKKLMQSQNITELEAGGYKAVCSVQQRETLNEAKLLELIKANGIAIEGLVKTKEYVDMDVLEDLIYKEQIPEDVLVQMDPCIEVKEVVTLRVTKIKKKEED